MCHFEHTRIIFAHTFLLSRPKAREPSPLKPIYPARAKSLVSTSTTSASSFISSAFASITKPLSRQGSGGGGGGANASTAAAAAAAAPIVVTLDDSDEEEEGLIDRRYSATF